MTQEEILKGNQLIAEFVELGKDLPPGEEVNIQGLSYHMSWDCLMPVVEKVENSKAKPGTNTVNEFPYSVIIRDISCDVVEDNNIPSSTRFNMFFGDTKIEAVWKSMVNFIEWYNKQTKYPL